MNYTKQQGEEDDDIEYDTHGDTEHHDDGDGSPNPYLLFSEDEDEPDIMDPESCDSTSPEDQDEQCMTVYVLHEEVACMYTYTRF